MSGESLIVIIIVGIIAGWLAGLLVRGGGFGILGDLVIGVVGAFIGDYVLAHLHVDFGHGIIGAIIDATIGAVILLIILRLIGGLGGFGRRY